MKRYGKYIKPYWPFFLVGPLLMLTEVVGEVLMPSMMADIINTGVPDGNTGFIVRQGLMMVGVAIMMLIGGVGGNYCACRASASFASDLRHDLYHKVQGFSFANLDTYTTGSLVTRLTNDVTQLQNVVRMAMIMLLRAPGMLIGAIIMAVSMNPGLALVIAAVLPVLIIAIVIVIRIGFPRFTIMQKKIDSLNSTIQEGLTNIRVIKSFVRSGHEIKRFGDANRDLKESSLKAMKVMIAIMPVMTFTMNFTTLAVVWFGGQQVIVGDMLVGDLTAFTTYVTQILMSLMMLSMILLQSSRAMASVRRITEVLETEVDLTDDKAGDRDRTVEKGKIEFRHVSFRYYKNREEKVLDDITFTANPGETVGIIGSTGSGKSSLVQLIPRLYDADEGQVLVDDVDVKEYSLYHLREGVGMVLQKNVLFSGTIEENLRWGQENAGEEELLRASRAAQADAFVHSFPDGYQTELGQGGVNVSGGQKQRLCIARALLKKPKILILDDSTSAVDTATEAHIREAFATTMKDSTKIIIAQRVSSVKDADRILVLEEGRITGMGTHEELLRENEEYREICESQMAQQKEAQVV